MIAFLRGRVLEKHPSRVVVDVQGVGYDLQVPVSTFYQVGDPGSEVQLRVHTHVREDALALFGFASALELQIFEQLIAVSGIGPRLALAVLSGIEPADLVRAVRQGDVARLTRIPGVGKKTAERIGLELKDRLARVEAAAPAGDDALRDDVVSALLNLGYPQPQADKAARAALAGGSPSFEAALKRALGTLTR